MQLLYIAQFNLIKIYLLRYIEIVLIVMLKFVLCMLPAKKGFWDALAFPKGSVCCTLERNCSLLIHKSLAFLYSSYLCTLTLYDVTVNPKDGARQIRMCHNVLSLISFSAARFEQQEEAPPLDLHKGLLLVPNCLMLNMFCWLETRRVWFQTVLKL